MYLILTDYSGNILLYFYHYSRLGSFNVKFAPIHSRISFKALWIYVNPLYVLAFENRVNSLFNLSNPSSTTETAETAQT